jgi:hypothetical protein
LNKGKLGVVELDADKRVEELEDILKWVMKSVDCFLEGDEFEHDEVNRALIMQHKVLNMLSERNTRISELEKELQRRKFFGLIGR